MTGCYSTLYVRENWDREIKREREREIYLSSAMSIIRRSGRQGPGLTEERDFHYLAKVTLNAKRL
jgi:hypothetical protein